MRRRALIVIGTLLFCLSQIGVNFLIYQYKNKNIEIPKVQLRDAEENKKYKKKSFAIMLEQDDGSYKTTSSNSFDQPGYVFNNKKSGCIDTFGNKIENALSYNSSLKSISLRINGAAFCYAYFDKTNNLYEACGSNTITNCESGGKLSKVGNLWQSGLEGDGYRYTGTNPNNYICFGTTDKGACTGNTDAYMYRIIGIFPDTEGNQYIKLIKKEALVNGYTWNLEYEDLNWGDNTLYKQLNDVEEGSTLFLENTTYMPNGWNDRIATWTWQATNTKTYESRGLSYYYNTSKNVYLHEMKKGVGANNCKYNSSKSTTCTIGEWTTAGAKIGLMYASDYLLALGTTESLDYNSGTNKEDFKSSWMYLWNANNDPSIPKETYEWTISRYGYNSYTSIYSAWSVNSNGSIYSYDVTFSLLVRPVFYLESNQVIKSGTGSVSDPFILK